MIKSIDEKLESMNKHYDNLEKQINMDRKHIKDNGVYMGGNTGNGGNASNNTKDPFTKS